MMKNWQQLLLDINIESSPDFDNFVIGHNQEIIDALVQVDKYTSVKVYLWGNTASGKTHLLKSSVSYAKQFKRSAFYLNAQQLKPKVLELPDYSIIAIDDIEQLQEAQQHLVFTLFNRSQIANYSLILSGKQPPIDLQIREDLRTRIGQCLIYRLQEFDDPIRLRILNAWLDRHNIQMQQAVLNYLITNGNRNLDSLIQVLQQLDLASLKQKRPITLPLLKTLIQQGLLKL